jgi:imidazole glycerol-phosphate synthase subunit HisF
MPPMQYGVGKLQGQSGVDAPCNRLPRMGIKTRVIPVLLWDDHGCVKGRGFDKSRRIGSIHDRIRLLERRDIDELIILDVSQRAPRFEELKEVIAPLFCPVTVGGGVKSLGDIRQLLASGADKVALNSAALERPAFVDEASRKFGAQAIVVAADVRSGKVGVRTGVPASGWDCADYARTVEKLGAGEILLTCVERDGWCHVSFP